MNVSVHFNAVNHKRSVFTLTSCSIPEKTLLEMTSMSSPVTINETGIDVVGPFHSSDGLETHTVGLKGHDVHQAVFKLITLQVGTDEP